MTGEGKLVKPSEILSTSRKHNYLFSEWQIQNGSEKLRVKLRFLLFHCRLVCFGDWEVADCMMHSSVAETWLAEMLTTGMEDISTNNWTSTASVWQTAWGMGT